MSNEPGGPAPVPDPYAVPDPAPTVPLAPDAPQAVAPSGYEAVRTPVGETAPTQPLPSTSPFAAPTPYGQPQDGAAPQYTTPQPQYGAPQYGAPQPPYGAPQPPYGAAQYGAPGYGQTPPPYGAQPYGYGQAYVTPPTEGMAIASFVTSTAGLLFLGGLPGPVGLGLGIAALRRIKVNGKAGRGWAIAGIAIGAFGILSMLAIAAYIIFVVALFATAGSSSGFWDDVEQGFEEGFEEGSDGATGGDASSGLPDFALRTDLTAGTCLTTYAWEYDMADTDPVDCAVPHEAEVVALVPMSAAVSLDPDDEFDTAFNDAWDTCDSITESLVPGYFADGNVELYYPHPDDFAGGVTSAYCVYYGDDAGMTGSALAGTLQLAGAGA
ncbi:DUF4190 domain-containing protein [Cellulomonas terrae]|uniref:DUF4190 domain-containing protein n=1 Tax=Cellulomonas terrae TaxID=311234 RepID=A0A511JN33_9CELL|nr:DUF4190 domain-containing protein [Cellulomonas terrae]GEL99437.1 hypothetical protein CTE05_29840 [Cellulomonas terrae]